jgi:two-component system, LytTR family, response regulator
MKFRALIVDDEPWARTRISSLLSVEADFTVARECAGGGEAVAAIVELEPDVVFLDVQMPEIGGFEVVEAIGADAMPVVIFATAHQEYALRAFDAGAVDYLLKPVDEARFRRTLERVRRDLETPAAASSALRETMAQVRKGAQFAERLVVNTDGRVVFVKVADIDWLEAAGNYVTIHAGREKFMFRETLRSLCERLDPAKFARLHRSSVVNVERLRELLPWSRGEQIAVLYDGTQLPIGRAFRDRLMEVMNGGHPVRTKP